MEDVRKASDELISTLRRAKELTENLLELSKAKETSLMSDDIGGLNELLAKEEDVMAAFKENEEERRLKARVLAAAAGAPGPGLKLRDIVESAGYPPDRGKIETLRAELAEELGRLMHQNEKVRELLQVKVQYTNFMINVLYVPESSLLFYNGQGGKENKAGGLNLLDCRA